MRSFGLFSKGFYALILTLSSVLLPVPASSAVGAQSAAFVVSKHLEKMGGERELHHVRSLHLILEIEESGTGFDIRKSEGNRYLKVWRTDQQGAIIFHARKNHGEYTLTNQTGQWRQLSDQEEPRKVENISVPERRAALELRDSFAPLYLLDYVERGIYLWLEKGKAFVGKHKCYLLKSQEYDPIQQGKQPIERAYYIGTSDFLLYRVKNDRSIEDYEDYRAVKGIMIPHRRSINFSPDRGGVSQKIRVVTTHISVNTQFSADLFTVLGLKRLVSEQKR